METLARRVPLVLLGLLSLLSTGSEGADAAGLVHFRDTAVVSSCDIRFSEVADLSALPPVLREPAERLSLGTLAGAGMRLPADRLATRARRQIPALAPWLSADDDSEVTVRFPPGGCTARPDATGPRRRAAPTGLMLSQAVPPGLALRTGDVHTANCRPEREAGRSVRFSAGRGIVIARETLAAGSCLPSYLHGFLATIRKGDPVELVARQGAVTISRRALSLQSGRSGQVTAYGLADGRVMQLAATEEGR